jgi:hypothetical protein
MLSRILRIALALMVAVVLIKSLPDAARYFKMRAM